MKRLIYLLIPILLTVLIIFSILKLFIFQDGGKGALQVTSHPFSKVYIDGTFLGNTPLCKCDGANMIKSGDYTLRLVPLDNSFSEFQEKITITKGVLSVVDRTFGKGATSEGSIISLQPLADKKATELLLVSFPDNADIFLDGNRQGKAPLHSTNLTDSDHTIRLQKDGYKDKNVRIRTPIGYKLVATIYLGLQNETSQITPTPQLTNVASPSASITVKKVSILQTPNGFLRVRETASLNAVEVGRVSTGAIFDVLDENDGWYKITLADGTMGWISSQYAQKQ